MSNASKLEQDAKMPNDTVTYIEPSGLKKFRIDFMVTGHVYYDVEAQSQEDAREMATKLWEEDDFGRLTGMDHSHMYSIEDEGGNVTYLK